MAAYNFPNSPSNGDTVTVNGVTYTYSSSKTRWDGAAASGSSTTVYATIDDLPLSGASTGDQAYVSGNNRLYIWNGSGWYNIALINTNPSISGASATYNLATDGTATTVTITATDPEGIPITYSIASDTSGNIATISQGTGSNTNVFTITPSTNSAHAGTFSLTFRASDGVNIATAASSFTLQFQVANSNYTTALITSVGANNAVNNSFDDSSTSNHSITATGNVTQNTFSPYRSGGYSAYLDGSGDYLSVADGTWKTFSTGDWTIEAFINTENASKRQYLFSDISSGGNNNSSSILLYLDGGVVKAYIQDTTYNLITGSTSITANQWHHVALVRNSTTVTLYLDGQSQGTYSIGTAAVNDSAEPLWIGSTSFSTSYDFVGYITDFRVVKGTAITPASGGPTERLTAVTNTSLLTCHLPYVADGSSNSHPITVNGNTKTEPLAPYDYSEYQASVNTGSAYFDGTGDYLSIPVDNAFQFGTGDFTIEMWFRYIGTIARYPIILGNGISGSGIYSGWAVYTDGNVLKLDRYTGSQTTVTFGSFTAAADTWHHLAIARSGTTIRGFINGTQVGSDITNSVSYNAHNTDPLNIGYGVDGAGTHQWNGYMSDIRIVKGTAVYTSDFTPPTEPLTAITNTSLLLPFDDAGIIDKSQSIKTLILSGNVKSSEDQYKFLTSSIYFDGTGDYLTAKDTDDFFDFGVGQFTVEFWFYKKASGAQVIVDARPSNTAAPWLVNINGSEYIQWYDGSAYAGTNTVALNTWTHFAVTRDSSNTLRIFKGGVVEHTTTNYTTDLSAHTQAIIGARSDGAASLVNGHISDLRITKGLARYTSNFTAPTAALQG